MIKLMAKIGFAGFKVCGHGRGGRVAYRMALDYPSQIEKLAVLDIVPTSDAWDRADDPFALAFWPWSLLGQSAPFPERLISAAPEAVIDNALEGWGSTTAAFPPQIKRAYVHALSDPDHIHAICEEYRAAATIDREHDAEDRTASRGVHCPRSSLPGAGTLERERSP
ncbi:pimeloyl-ACP methyl ester carboxylesterase [Neorhizobium sp. 2083]|nr:pimeloyl-ACP methyl ester carboxylesterase [Neorhizobium sp. 2083]